MGDNCLPTSDLAGGKEEFRAPDMGIRPLRLLPGIPCHLDDIAEADYTSCDRAFLALFAMLSYRLLGRFLFAPQ